METPPPIHLLPNELLMKIIEKLPRTQWPSLELVDHKFRDAVLLAWGSIRQVDIERDFLYSESIADEDENDDDYEMIEESLRRQSCQKTEVILKKLSKRSPFITSLSGVSLITDDPSLNTTAIQYLSRFELLETIKFAKKDFSDRFLYCHDFRLTCVIPLISFIEFLESTQSRATLKEIDQCYICDYPIMDANLERLRAVFGNNSNDPARQLLQLVSISMQIIGATYPFTFIDTIDTSRLTKLSLGNSHVEPDVLTALIHGAPQLQHLDFAFLHECKYYDNTACNGGRLQPNKELLAASHPSLTSLGFNSILGGCACDRFEAEFKHMLRSIGPQLVNFVFKPGFFSRDIHMGEIHDIIQHHMPNLKSIKLDACCAVNRVDLRGIADGKELEELEIVSYNDDGYVSIGNDQLSTIIRKSPRLKRFIGVDCYPDQRLVIALCKLSDLHDLRIEAAQLTEICFFAFSQAFAEKLQVLHLGELGHTQGVESGLIEFVGKAAQLRELVVSGYVTDRLLECLAESCPNLEKFGARWYNGITLVGAQMLVDSCPKLRWLHVDNTERNLASSLKNLKLDRYRKLKLEF